MNKTIVSVGMGPGQLEFIKRCKELGYTVIAFGKGINDKEAMELADYHDEIDTYDAESAIKWIDSLSIHIDAVGSYAGGRAVLTVQKLENYYNTATKIPERFLISSDKADQQKLYSEFELSSIKTWRVNELNYDLINASNESRYILKPGIGRGSEGIRFLTKGELLEYISNEANINDRDVVQIARDGLEYRVVIIVQDCKLKLLAPVLRKSFKDTAFLGVLKYDDTNLLRLTEFVEKFVKKAQITNSIIKADIIVSKEQIDLIEMDIGVGGGSYYMTFVSHIYDRSLMDDYIKLVTGQEIKKYKPKQSKLRMDYVFNEKAVPVSYNLEICKKRLSDIFGESKIIVNSLRPECKKGFNSSADFLFAVIHDDSQEHAGFYINDYVNEHLLMVNLI